jgi:hypothetical protein
MIRYLKTGQAAAAAGFRHDGAVDNLITRALEPI